MSACIKKSLIKIGEFFVAVLILKVEENTQHFWHSVLYYFKEGKMQLKRKISFVPCVEKVL